MIAQQAPKTGGEDPRYPLPVGSAGFRREETMVLQQQHRRATREAIRRAARFGARNRHSRGTAMNRIVDIRAWPFPSQQRLHLRGKLFARLSYIVQVNSAGIYA